MNTIILLLISLQGSPDFTTRQDASNALVQVGKKYNIDFQLAVHSHNSDKEIAKRCVDVYSRIYVEKLADYRKQKIPGMRIISKWVTPNGQTYDTPYMNGVFPPHIGYIPGGWKSMEETVDEFIADCYNRDMNEVEICRVIEAKIAVAH